LTENIFRAKYNDRNNIIKTDVGSGKNKMDGIAISHSWPLERNKPSLSGDKEDFSAVSAKGKNIPAGKLEGISLLPSPSSLSLAPTEAETPSPPSYSSDLNGLPYPVFNFC
jgi:hypothetical protein